MDADHSAPVCESGEVLIDAPPEAVWDTLTDFESWPGWMSGVKALQIDEPVRVGTKFVWKAGPSSIRSEVLESERPGRVAWKGRTMGITALHVWRIEAQGDTSRVFTEESWSGPMARLLRGSMRRTVRNALDDGLPAPKHEAERRARSMP